MSDFKMPNKWTETEDSELRLLVTYFEKGVCIVPTASLGARKRARAQVLNVEQWLTRARDQRQLGRGC